MVSSAPPLADTGPKDQPLLSAVSLKRRWTWQPLAEQRFYMYDVHALHSHFDVANLAAALHLFVLRLLHHDYTAAWRLVPACCTDRRLSESERRILASVVGTSHDRHPEARSRHIIVGAARTPMDPPLAMLSRRRQRVRARKAPVTPET